MRVIGKPKRKGIVERKLKIEESIAQVNEGLLVKQETIETVPAEAMAQGAPVAVGRDRKTRLQASRFSGAVDII